MSDFNVIKCPSCNSSVVLMQGENLDECIHCGSKLHTKKSNKKNKLYTLMVYGVGLLVLIGVGFFWFYTKAPVTKENLVKLEQHKTQLPVYRVPKLNLPKVDTSAILITNDEVKKYQDSLAKPKVDVISQVKGTTPVGGLFWIIKVENNNLFTVARPGVIMSLFDVKNKQFEELRVWSKKTQLEQGESSIVLVSLTKPPQEKFTIKIHGMAKIKSDFDPPQQVINVEGFTVKNIDDTGKRVEIIGDVTNPNAYQVDYVEVIAVAYDENNIAVGIASTFSSKSNLLSKQNSDFRISSGSFIVKEAKKWKVWAFGRKHKPLR